MLKNPLRPARPRHLEEFVARQRAVDEFRHLRENYAFGGEVDAERERVGARDDVDYALAEGHFDEELFFREHRAKVHTDAAQHRVGDFRDFEYLGYLAQPRALAAAYFMAGLRGLRRGPFDAFL